MRKQNKPMSIGKQSQKVTSKKSMADQNSDEIYIKIQKIQKQIASLNLDIKYLMDQKIFKNKIQRILQKEKKNLENCFLFKSVQKSREISDLNSQTEPQKNKIKNRFRDVNQRIVQFIQQLQSNSQKQNAPIPPQNQYQDATSKPIQKLQCQSLHLKQIFNPQQSQCHEVKVLKLKEKLNLLYEKIHINLERQEPYLYEKILERIKRQAQHQTRKKLLQQIQKLSKENSVWISQQTNRVSNELEEQKVEQVCVSNLSLMKKIMSKKVYNNDWIFENYGDKRFANEGETTFPVQQIRNQYQSILKRLQQKRIADQLSMFRGKNASKDQEEGKKSLKQMLSSTEIQNLLQEKDANEDNFHQIERELLQTVENIQQSIQKLTKS